VVPATRDLSADFGARAALAVGVALLPSIRGPLHPLGHAHEHIGILRAWRRARPSFPNGLVFPADDGSPHTKGYDGQWADRWRAETGTRPEVRFHDLRHTCGASLISGVWGRAWRLEDVQSFLGHESLASTERYAHLAPEGVFAAAAATPGSSRHGPRHKTQGREK
jgi:integrase